MLVFHALLLREKILNCYDVKINKNERCFLELHIKLLAVVLHI